MRPFGISRESAFRSFLLSNCFPSFALSQTHKRLSEDNSHPSSSPSLPKPRAAMSPERSVECNELGPPDAVDIEPPAGCSSPTKLSLPRIAAPAMCNKTSNMNALLINSHALNAAISALILGSDTLKAWFAYRICHAGGRRRFSAQWKDIEHWFVCPHSPLPVEFQEHNGDFRVCSDPGYLEGTEFFARVVFTLMHKIQDNPTGTPSHGERLIYHTYYQTQQQEFFSCVSIPPVSHQVYRQVKPFLHHSSNRTKKTQSVGNEPARKDWR